MSQPLCIQRARSVQSVHKHELQSAETGRFVAKTVADRLAIQQSGPLRDTTQTPLGLLFGDAKLVLSETPKAIPRWRLGQVHPGSAPDRVRPGGPVSGAIGHGARAVIRIAQSE